MNIQLLYFIILTVFILYAMICDFWFELKGPLAFSALTPKKQKLDNEKDDLKKESMQKMDYIS